MPVKGSGRGVRVHHKGYLQITRRGRWYGWLEHRKVMMEACLKMCYYPLNGNLPAGMTVEHLDHNRQHNCIENLLMLDKRIHDFISFGNWGLGESDRLAKVEKEVAAAAAETEEPDWING